LTRTRPKATSRLTCAAGRLVIETLLYVARTFHYAATASLEGIFVFWCAIAQPAFRRMPNAHDVQARYDRRLTKLGWLSLGVAIVAGIGWLVGVSSRMSGLPLAAVLQQGVIRIVLTQTRFGEDWLWRGAVVIVLGLCLAARGSSGKSVARWIGLIAAAAFDASLVWAGHGAAADDLPYDFLHFPADLVHLLATGAWLGALVPLALLLAEARRNASLDAARIARISTLRFSTLGITCVGLLIVSGIVNTWFLSGSIPALVGTLYGRLLILKVTVFAAMIAIANVNRTRLIPALERREGAMRKLSRNALTEASLGIFVLAIVGIIGTLPPGLHTEPRWPFPYRLDFAEIAVGGQKLLDIAATLFVLCLAASALAAERRRYRGMVLSVAGLVIFGSIAAVAMRPGIVRAYPTTYFASTQAYAAPSIAHGEPLYAANCTPCHGIDGRGDGPIAKSLPIPPADLTEEHIFAHNVGDLYWWIGHGRAGGVMPGFEKTLTPQQRWDLINFVLARAAGIQTAQVGDRVSASAAPPVPDFAFERRGAQNTLSQTLKGGPVLLVLFAEPAPVQRLQVLAKLPVRVLAVDLGKAASQNAPLAVNVSDDVRATLGLFRSPQDGGETELMLDRNGSVRARWTASGKAGLAAAPTLLADATAVAKIPAAAANHAGHGG
jgi:putative copper resistance protein D